MVISMLEDVIYRRKGRDGKRLEVNAEMLESECVRE
jgi:hypothetical protein